MIKIAHFLRDDNKFIPDSIWCFENCGLVDNTFFCVGKQLHRLQDSRVILVDEERVRKMVENSGDYDVICLHSLYSLPLSIIPLINKSIKVVWYSWGYDIYMNPRPYSPLLNDIDIYLPDTNEILNKIPEDVLPIKTRIKKYLIEVFHKKEASSLLQDSVERVDFFAGVFPMEFDMLKRKYEFFRANRTSHNYIHPDEFQNRDLLEPIELTGNNILLGHSACSEDNHLDVMKKLADYSCADTNIICPLSYGGSKYYINYVVEKGKYYFGSHFKPILEFLPFDEYTKLQKSCNRFMLGAIRQQATCNCLSAIWSGIQLFLYGNSMNYIQYKDFGINVFDIELGVDYSLTQEQLLKNRTIIESIYSYRAWKNDIDIFINQINCK